MFVTSMQLLLLKQKSMLSILIGDAPRCCYVYLLHAKDEAFDKFKIYKTRVEFQQNGLIKTLPTDIKLRFLIHQNKLVCLQGKNGVSEKKKLALKEKVNFMLPYSGLSDGFWGGESILSACYLLNRFTNIRGNITPCDFRYKKQPTLNYLRVWGWRVVVRLHEPKGKTLGEKLKLIVSLLDMPSIPKLIGFM